MGKINNKMLLLECHLNPIVSHFVNKIGKLKFQITNQQITIQTQFQGLKFEDIPKQNMQQCAAKFAAPDFRIENFTKGYWELRHCLSKTKCFLVFTAIKIMIKN